MCANIDADVSDSVRRRRTLLEPPTRTRVSRFVEGASRAVEPATPAPVAVRRRVSPTTSSGCKPHSNHITHATLTRGRKALYHPCITHSWKESTMIPQLHHSRVVGRRNPTTFTRASFTCDCEYPPAPLGDANDAKSPPTVGLHEPFRGTPRALSRSSSSSSTTCSEDTQRVSIRRNQSNL